MVGKEADWRRIGRDRIGVARARIGLLLGAGGVLGGAWSAGALAALARMTGWQPRGADVILGTSAGAVLAAVLAAGLTTAEILPTVTEKVGGRAPLADLVLETAYRAAARRLRVLPGSIGLAARALRERSLFRLLCGLLPRGLVATTTIEEAIARVVPRGWAPHPACWVVACDYGTGDRVAFGSPGAPMPALSRGVAASCAIPGFFSPVGIGGRWYVDGGVTSMSNADLLAGQGLDVVVVLSPMSGRARTRGWAPLNRIMAMMRAWSASRPDAELTRLRRSGTAAVVLEPTDVDLEAIGPRLMDARRAERVAGLACETTVGQLERPAARRWMEALAAAA